MVGSRDNQERLSASSSSLAAGVWISHLHFPRSQKRSTKIYADPAIIASARITESFSSEVSMRPAASGFLRANPVTICLTPIYHADFDW